MAKGSFFKEVAKDGSVSWRVRVDMVDPATGKRRQPQRTYKTKREAEAGLAEWLVEIERGTAVVASRTTVSAYLSYWLDTSARHRLRPTTLESYEQKVRLYIVPVLGAVPIQRLTSAQVQAFYGSLLRGERAVSPRTVRYVHAILHRALKEAVSLGIVSRNVTDAVAPPKAPRPPIKSWDVAEAQRFLAVAATDHYHPLWLIALHTGMRRGELLGLRWADVDLTRAVLHVRQAIVSVAYRPRVAEPKSASGRRTIALDDVCVSALRQHRARQAERRLACGASWQEHDLVFASAVGTPLDLAPFRQTGGCDRRPPHPLPWPTAHACDAAHESGRSSKGGQRAIGAREHHADIADLQPCPATDAAGGRHHLCRSHGQWHRSRPKRRPAGRARRRTR